MQSNIKYFFYKIYVMCEYISSMSKFIKKKKNVKI